LKRRLTQNLKQSEHLIEDAAESDKVNLREAWETFAHSALKPGLLESILVYVPKPTGTSSGTISLEPGQWVTPKKSISGLAPRPPNLPVYSYFGLSLL
jgi:hypothetical protein